MLASIEQQAGETRSNNKRGREVVATVFIEARPKGLPEGRLSRTMSSRSKGIASSRHFTRKERR
jgi:hypothetical protein